MRRYGRHLAGLLAIGATLVCAQSASAATLTVDNTTDASGQPCVATPGDCSLRSAVELAGSGTFPGHDDIAFAPTVFDGGATVPSVIDVGSNILIQSDLSITGGDCDPGAGAKPCVGINSTGDSITLFTFTSDPVTFSGLAIWGTEGSAIAAQSDLAPTVTGSWFGVHLDGTTLEANDTGVSFLNAGGGTIGGDTVAERNVFAASNNSAVNLGNTDNNLIAGNRVGVLPGGGSVAAGALSQAGIDIFGTSDDNTIGGEADTVGQCDGECNLVVNQGGTGVRFIGAPDYGADNTVKGNFIGLGANGSADQGNGNRGLDVGDAQNTIVGGTDAERNYIAGNGAEGIWGIGNTGADFLAVTNNYIGLAADGETAIPNGGVLSGSGVYMPGVSSNATGNRFGGNGAWIKAGATFENNVIGVGPDGEDVGVSNDEPGLMISGNSNVVTGNTIGNVKVAGNAAMLLEAGASSNTIQNNFIGTTSGGTVAPNVAQGIRLGGSNALADNNIGGLDAFEPNFISNSGTDAILQTQAGAGNRYEGNYGKNNGSGPNDLFIDIGPDGPGNPTNFSNDGIVAPTGVTVGVTSASGPAGSVRSGAKVVVYATYTSRGNVRKPLGNVTAQPDGSWSVTYPAQTTGQCIAAGQTDAGNDSSSELTTAVAVGGGTCVKPPITLLTGGPVEGSTIPDNTPTFTFTSEAGAGFECSIDGGAFGTCLSPFTPNPLSDGPHLLEFRAVQLTPFHPALGRDVGDPIGRAFVVDTTGPTTTFTSGPAQGSTIGTSSTAVGFTANEAGSTFQCSVDGAAFATCISPVALSGLADGAHSVAVRGTDTAGNTGPVVTRSFSVDTRVPAVQIGGVGKKGKTATVTFTGSGSGTIAFACKLDNGGFTPCTSPKKYGKLRPGRHTVTVQATDSFGRTGTSAPASFKIKKPKKKKK